MVPVSLFIWLIVEVGCYLAIGRRLFDADWLNALLGAVGGLLGVRAGINAITWAFASAYGAPAPPLGIAPRLAMVFREYLAFLITFLFILPFERLWMPADRLNKARPVVVLVHGYGCSRGVWWRLRRRLEKRGFNVATLSLVPPYISIDHFVSQLDRRIKDVLAQTETTSVTLVGHSMGGLVCRAYLATQGNAAVSRLITLATPHRGTALAQVGIGQNARQMEIDSPWLTRLAQSPNPTPSICLCNRYDNYAMPQDRQVFPGARQIDLPPCGHLTLLYDLQVAQRLIEVLEITP